MAADSLSALRGCLDLLVPLDAPSRVRVLDAIHVALGDEDEDEDEEAEHDGVPPSDRASPPAQTRRATPSPKAQTRRQLCSDGQRNEATILSLLRTSRDGMSPAMVATATGLATSTAIGVMRRLLSTGTLKTTGVQGSKSVRYHLAEGVTRG